MINKSRIPRIANVIISKAKEYFIPFKTFIAKESSIRERKISVPKL